MAPCGAAVPLRMKIDGGIVQRLHARVAPERDRLCVSHKIQGGAGIFSRQLRAQKGLDSPKNDPVYGEDEDYMDSNEKLRISSEILRKAKEFDATLVGIASVEELKRAPSFTVAPKMPEYSGVGADKEKIPGLGSGEVAWPEGARSVIVIAFAHPENQPELDYWYGSISPIGNRRLMATINKLVKWLNETYDVRPCHLPYHVERGGIFLKDAAVLGGLGCIGKNNMLVTPEYGPRVRLRAMTVNIDLPSTGPLNFDPCAGCDESCTKACPEEAFSKQLYKAKEYGREELPGRRGNYDRLACNIQMKLDENIAEIQEAEDCDQPLRVVKYCRKCEFACWVGK